MTTEFRNQRIPFPLPLVPTAAKGLLSQLPSPLPDRVGWPWTEETLAITKLMPDGRVWPRISIVTPSYNQGKFLEETIRSVLLQNYPNLEYVIIDGGSTDNSLDIIKKYEPWVTYWISEPDRGQSHAINKGFALSTGEILAYINSDDFYAAGAFVEAANYLSRAKVDLICGRVKEIPSGNLLLPVLPESLFAFIKSFYCSLPQPGCFWRQNALLPFFDENLHCVFDRKFFMQLVEKGLQFSITDKVVACFRVHSNSKTSQLEGEFFNENMQVNLDMLQYLPSSERQILRKHLHYLTTRSHFHQIEDLSIKGIASIFSVLREQPAFLIKREFYGRLKYICFRRAKNSRSRKI